MADGALGRPRERLGIPPQGDGTARGGYGRDLFERDRWACAYCGLQMLESFDLYLQLSVDHIVPRSTKGCDPSLLEDTANTVTCCRACNEFGNRYQAIVPAPMSEDGFWDMRDQVFAERKALILQRREKEQEQYDHLRKSTSLPGDFEIVIPAAMEGAD